MTKQNRIKFLNRTLAALLALTLILPLAACNSEETPPAADPTPTPETIENFYTFADGTVITRRPSEHGPNRTEYVLPNGMPLLETGGGTHPSDTELEGVGKLSDLGDEAQAAIRAYYDEQGLLYDLNAELERLYGEYIAANYNREDTSWGDCLLTQDTQPTGGDHDTIFFTTYVSRPHVTAGTTDTTDELITDYTVEQHTTAFRKTDGTVVTADTEGVYTLSDGTRVDLWNTLPFGNYKLPDGTTLLRHDSPDDPANVSAGSLNLDILNETAQAAIVAHYEEQGLLYDLEAELEEAYAEYLACADSNSTYSPGIIGQSVVPSAESERVIYITTSVRLPVGGGMYEERWFDTAFDRETGELIDPLDLFTVPADELADIILDLSTVPDAAILAEMDAAFSVDYIGFGLDGLLIEYPAGTLPSSELAFSFSVYYADLTGIIHPWALPQ